MTANAFASFLLQFSAEIYTSKNYGPIKKKWLLSVSENTEGGFNSEIFLLVPEAETEVDELG